MSEFLGRMREYKQLSIDRFDGQNLKSTAFFLSHCHKDHMTGLDSPSFIERLRSRTDVFLYCTEISKIILLADPVYRPLEKYIKVLTSEEAEMISVPDPASCKSTDILVTSLPALHCPGSVMFLFEGDEGTVLYTGDFRWETNHAISISSFKTGESLKEIESMYIDTTFCVGSAFHFPSRKECCDVSCNIVNDWLSRSNQHYVHITSKTNYGHEPLMKALHLSTGYKIHVPEWKYDIYSQIAELREVFTSDPTTRIHACNRVHNKAADSKLPCGFVPSDGQEVYVRSIRPSTMFFTMGHSDVQPASLHVAGRHLHRVCYSFHSSYSEVRDVVMYLKPKRVVPNVKPAPDKHIREVQQRLNKFLKLPHLLHFSSPHKNLGKLKHRRPFKSVRNKELTDSDDLVFDSQSPVKVSRSLVLKTPEKTGEEHSSDVTSPTKMDDSQVSSSYEPSLASGEELSLVESCDEELSLVESSKEVDGQEAEGGDTEESFRLYVSGDDEVDEDERVSTLSFTQSCSEGSQKTGESTVGDEREITSDEAKSAGGDSVNTDAIKNICVKSKMTCLDETKGEITSEGDRCEIKLRTVQSEQCGLTKHGAEKSGDTNENRLESFSMKDKNRDDNENNSLTFSDKDKVSDDANESDKKSSSDKDKHDKDEQRVEKNERDKNRVVDFVLKKRNERHDNVNGVHLVSKTDDDDSNQNKKIFQGNKDKELGCIKSLHSEKSSDLVSSMRDDLSCQSSPSETPLEEDFHVTDLTHVQPSNSDVSLQDSIKLTVAAPSSCTVNSKIKKQPFLERTNSFDLFEEDAEERVEESQGFGPECLPTDMESNDVKVGDSEGFSHCPDGVLLDEVHKTVEPTKEDTKGVLSGGDSRSSLDGVDHVKLVLSGHSENEVCDPELNTKSVSVSSDTIVSSNDGSQANQLKMKIENKSVNENSGVNLADGGGDGSRPDVLVSEKMAHSPQAPAKGKRKLSFKDHTKTQSSMVGDDASGHQKKSRKHASKFNRSNADHNNSGQMSKSSSMSDLEQNEAYDGDSEDNDEYDECDVVVIDVSDSDSQEPPHKKWKRSSKTESEVNTSGACVSTSQNKSVLDHLEKLKSVLHNGHESDSELTQPPSDDSCSGFYSDSDIQIISDEDDEDDNQQNAGQNSYLQNPENVTSTGWYSARSGGNSCAVHSNKRLEDEDVCIDLTGDDD